MRKITITYIIIGTFLVHDIAKYIKIIVHKSEYVPYDFYNCNSKNLLVTTINRK